MSYFTGAIKKYAEFSGRASRKEYWMFVLFYIIFYCVAGIVDSLAKTQFTVSGETVGVIATIYSVALLLPFLGVTIRRLHDIDKSGWFILLGLIPLVGEIILLVFYCKAGTEGENKYGADPKVQAE